MKQVNSSLHIKFKDDDLPENQMVVYHEENNRVFWIISYLGIWI